MSFALPVVATRVGGIPELVEDGWNGFLVEREDTQAMAAKIRLLVADADLRRGMGEHSEQRCEERFDVRRMAREYLRGFAGAQAAARADEVPVSSRA